VIAGLIYELIFGLHVGSATGLRDNEIDRCIFAAFPGIVLARIRDSDSSRANFIPLMQRRGNEAEEAARVLGRSGWQILGASPAEREWACLRRDPVQRACDGRISAPVSSVSGHIRGDQQHAAAHRVLTKSTSFAAAFCGLLAVRRRWRW